MPNPTINQSGNPSSSDNWGWPTSFGPYSAAQTVTFSPESGWTLASINGVSTNTFQAAANTSYTIGAEDAQVTPPGSDSTSLSISSGGNDDDGTPH